MTSLHALSIQLESQW